jgi:hypothetical protein
MSTPDENQPMREALQRDATRVSKPDFDPALHYATMRRLRSLAKTPNREFRWAPALAATTAVLALAVSLVHWRMPPLPENQVASQSQSGHSRHAPASPSLIVPTPAAARTSALTYQTAANQGEDVLFALLDRDARELLPASPPVFNSPLH